MRTLRAGLLWLLCVSGGVVVCSAWERYDGPVRERREQREAINLLLKAGYGVIDPEGGEFAEGWDLVEGRP